MYTNYTNSTSDLSNNIVVDAFYVLVCFMLGCLYILCTCGSSGGCKGGCRCRSSVSRSRDREIEINSTNV